MTCNPDLATEISDALMRFAVYRPADVAAIDDSGSISHGELAARVAALSDSIGAQVERGARIGVMIRVGIDQHVVILSVMLAGCVYVPLDPAWSKQRIDHICRDAEVECVIIDTETTLNDSDGLPAEVLELRRLQASTPQYAHGKKRVGFGGDAYCMYTSGTTGAPKGVATSWPALHNRLAWMQELYPLSNSDVVSVKTSCGFDVSVWEHLWPRMYGACAALFDVQARGLHELYQSMKLFNVTVCHFVPSVARALLGTPDVEPLVSLRFVAMSGEVLDQATAAHMQRMAPLADVYNMYGPTECAIDVSFWKFAIDDPFDPVPIGTGAPGCEITIKADSGTEGELHIGGVQVAAGYIGNARGAGGFHKDPERGWSYATGDTARFVGPDLITVIGRSDRQLKLNGVRVELDGLEAVVRQHPDVRSCAVIARADQNGPSIVIAIVPRNGRSAPSAREFRAHLRQTSAMEDVALRIVEVDSIVLSSSGKTDYEAVAKALASWEA